MKNSFLLLTAVMGLAAFQAQAQTLGEMGQVTNVEGTMTGNATNAANTASSSAAGRMPVYTPSLVPVTPAGSVTPAPVLLAAMPASAKPAEMVSLFFTSNELASIMRANQGFLAPKEAFDEKNQGKDPNDRGPRTITLSGIVYNSPGDWTIWVNGERITPKNIPDRIMAVTVKADKIYLKWMDIGNQRIVNLTLAPHQRYDLDRDTITPADW